MQNRSETSNIARLQSVFNSATLEDFEKNLKNLPDDISFQNEFNKFFADFTRIPNDYTIHGSLLRTIRRSANISDNNTDPFGTIIKQTRRNQSIDKELFSAIFALIELREEVAQLKPLSLIHPNDVLLNNVVQENPGPIFLQIIRHRYLPQALIKLGIASLLFSGADAYPPFALALGLSLSSGWLIGIASVGILMLITGLFLLHLQKNARSVSNHDDSDSLSYSLVSSPDSLFSGKNSESPNVILDATYDISETTSVASSTEEFHTPSEGPLPLS